MSAGIQNELDRLRTDRDHYKRQVEGLARELTKAEAERDRLSKTIHRVRTLPITAIESKDTYIGRLRQILDEAP